MPSPPGPFHYAAGHDAETLTGHIVENAVNRPAAEQVINYPEGELRNRFLYRTAPPTRWSLAGCVDDRSQTGRGQGCGSHGCRWARVTLYLYSPSRGRTIRIDRLIVNRFGKRVSHADAQAAGESSSQRKLRGVIVRITAVVEISNFRTVGSVAALKRACCFQSVRQTLPRH